MPSLAKKSMNFMRDVYALANEHANSGRPSTQPPLPVGGLSAQFSAPPNQQYNNSYSSSYYRPVSSQGQASFPQPHVIPGPNPQHVSVPQQPYGSWSPTPPTNFPPPPIHHSLSDPNVHHGYTPPPQQYQMTPTTSISSPVSPESQTSTPASGQFQYFPPQKPPLPARQPSQHTPQWNHQPHVNSSPYHSPSSTFSPPLGSFPPPVQYASPPPQNGYDQYNTNPQYQNVNGFPEVRPLPPPLPQRPMAQATSPAPSEVGSQIQQHHHHGPLPALTVSGPPTAGVYHEMSAEPIVNRPRTEQQNNKTESTAELHASEMQNIQSRAPTQPAYLAELPGSPATYSEVRPSSAHQSTTSWPASAPTTAPSGPPSPLQSSSTQTSEHLRHASQSGQVAPDVNQFLTSPSQQSSQQHLGPNVSPQTKTIPMVQQPQPHAANQPPLHQQFYPPPPPPPPPASGLPYIPSDYPPTQQYQHIPTMPTSPPVSPAPVATINSTSQTPFDMSSLSAAVNDVNGRQSPWQHQGPPPNSYPQNIYHNTMNIPNHTTGTTSIVPSQNYPPPHAGNNASYDQSLMVRPQLAAPVLSQHAVIQSHVPMMQPYQHQWPEPANGQIYTLPPTPQMTPQLPTSQHVQGGPDQADPRRAPENLPNTMRVQRNGDQPRVRKILSLDGGGVRGLSSLIILNYLMDMLSNIRGARLEPWQEFDMIAGTSTGGLIAIMLGRLRMSVADCIEAYKHLSKEIFTPAHSSANVAGKAVDFLKAKGRFRSEPLERCIKEILKKHNLSEDELMIDQNPDSPAMFVCAVEGLNTDAVVIRSYKSKEFDDLYGVCKIWEAARATSAASTFFDPINIAGRDYVDGALKHNNPIEKVDEESREKWPSDERLIISIGTGSAPGPDVTGDLKDVVEALKKIVTETEDRSNAFRKRNKDMIAANRLFRFNVFHGLADVGLAEHEAAGKVAAHTATYLKKYDTAREVELCASSLSETGQRLGYIAGEELAIYREVQRVSTTTCEFCEDCHRGIPYSEPLFYCPEDGMLFCKDCQITHDDGHMRKILRFKSLQWMSKISGAATTASCWHCAKETKVRWGCEKCDLALCRRCVGNMTRRDEFLKEHQTKQPDHRTFLAIYPPYWTTTNRWIRDICGCGTSQETPLYHCDRCHDIMNLGARCYNCSTCSSEFGSSQVLCQACYQKEDQTHLSKHRWQTTDFVKIPHGPDELDKVKIYYTCQQCPGEEIQEGREHLHQHLNLQMPVYPLVEELCRFANRQFCQRARIARDKAAAVDPTELLCKACHGFVCFNKKASICFTKKCLWTYCEDCMNANAIHHRHPLVDVTIERTPANATNIVRCCTCSEMIVAGLFKGLWCSDCNNYDVCLQCFAKVEQGTLTLPDKLPHIKILKQCKTRNWIWYI